MTSLACLVHKYYYTTDYYISVSASRSVAMDEKGVPPEQLTSPGYPAEQAPPPSYPQAPPPQASYPPPQEQPGYPPQPGYPQSQQPGYPPQQPGYPAQQPYPQQQAYPQPAYAQQAYPQQAYPHQEAPPPYYPQQPPAPQIGVQQQQQHNVMLVQQQPQVFASQVRYYGGGDQGMALAIISTFVAVFFGCWLSLVCSIPAIVFASSAQSAAARGEEDVARQNKNYSTGLSIAGIVTGVAFYLGWIIAIIVIASF